jgi:hypothetical protein
MNDTELTIAATSAETAAFELVQRQAKMLASSNLLPKEFQNNMANCAIALNMAKRMGADPFMIAQNLDIIHGRPSFRATFLIAMVNASKRFTPLQFRLTETAAPTVRNVSFEVWENNKKVPREIKYEYTPTTCVAYATSKETGEMIEGPPVSYDLAIDEGWVGKAGSKWQTSMRELMLRYRAAAFFARLYAPDITLGMQTAEEAEDIDPPERNITPAKVPVVAGLFAPPSDYPEISQLDELRFRLASVRIDGSKATEYLRSQAVTEAATFDDITDDEARAAITGFGHLVSALSRYTEPQTTTP